MKTIFLLPLLVGSAFGQDIAAGCAAISEEAAMQQFDVASVKRAEPPKVPLTGNPFAITGGPGTGDPGHYMTAHTGLATLIMRAYGLVDADQLKGPSWLSDAMGSGYALGATLPPSTTQEGFCGMLRNLLADRFHLKFHIEKQSRPGHEMTVLPGGPRFREFVTGSGPFSVEFLRRRENDANGFPILSPGEATAMALRASPTGETKLSFRNNMAAFASRLAVYISQSDGASPAGELPRVVDRTGLSGIYDIRIDFAGTPFPTLGGRKPVAATPDPVDAGPNIFAAVQKQLGLKLTKIPNVPVDVIVVDHIDQIPTEN